MKFSEWYQLREEKDACYHKVKSRYRVWPSAYSSGALVRCRKVGAANWGNKTKKKKKRLKESNVLTWDKDQDFKDPSKINRAQNFIDSARKEQDSKWNLGKADVGGVQPWSKGEYFPWTIKQVGSEEGYFQGLHPNGQKTSKYYFKNGETSLALKRAEEEIKDNLNEALANKKQYDDAIQAVMALSYKGLNVETASNKEIEEALTKMGKNPPEGTSMKLFAARIKSVAKGNTQPEDFKEGTFDLEKKKGLHGWFSRKAGGWIDCKASKKGKLVPCGRKTAGPGAERSYPACRPTLSACNKKGTRRKKSSKPISWK